MLEALLLMDLHIGEQNRNDDEALLLTTGDAKQPRMGFGGDAAGLITPPRSQGYISNTNSWYAAVKKSTWKGVGMRQWREVGQRS